MQSMPDLTKLCRACLTTIDSFTYIFFDNISPDVYWFCTSIEVVKDEELPKALCNVCYDLLFKLSKFKETCIQSHKTLLNYSIKPEYDKILNNSCKSVEINENDKNCSFKQVFSINDITVKEEDCIDNYGNDFDSPAIIDNPQLPENITKIYKRLREKPKKKRKKLTCELCNKKFFNIDILKLHKLRHQSKGTLKCTPCNKTFITWSGLSRHHSNWHARVRLNSVKCRTCGKIAKTKETLKAHEKLHGERQKFICNVCGRGCTSSYILKAHLETHKENRERQYTCEHCGKKFYTKKILMSHVTRCHTGKRFICQICSYPFTDKYNLAKHLLNHDGKKFFKCEVCNKGFSTRSSYTEHQRIHSGERPYVCSYCSKSFISKRRLTEHHRVHTGEKPYKCSICEHGFAQRGTLTRHMKVHDRVPSVVN